MPYPPLPETISILDGTSVDEAFERFHVFEAMHHGMDLCNPLSSDDLDRVIAALDPQSGQQLLDIACGHGELLLRAAERTDIKGTGVDLSPWVLLRAEARARARGSADRLTWQLGDAAETPDEPVADLVSCLGASWIWDGFAGTVDALIARTRMGGRFAVGDVQRLPDTAPANVAEAFGVVLGPTEQAAFFESRGVRVIEEIRPSRESWDAYDDRIAASASSFGDQNPGPLAEQALSLHLDWNAEHAEAQRQVRWTVWVAELPS